MSAGDGLVFVNITSSQLLLEQGRPAPTQLCSFPSVEFGKGSGYTRIKVRFF